MAVEGGYVMRGRHEVGFRVGAYDRTRPLVIDPVIVYSTYLGGGGTDVITSITVDDTGNAYVAGFTSSGAAMSEPFPWTNGIPPASCCGGGFVAKLNPSGSTLLFASFIDGIPYAIALGASGDIFLGGWTGSTSFPTTPGSFQPVAPAGGAR